MTFPVVDQNILDQSKSIISTMVSQLVGAGAQYVYVIDNPSNGRTPLFYFHAVANATDPTDQEEIEGIFNNISMIWGNNVEEANAQKWDAVSQASPSSKIVENAVYSWFSASTIPLSAAGWFSHHPGVAMAQGRLF